jgi:hypothetical protein
MMHDVRVGVQLVQGVRQVKDCLQLHIIYKHTVYSYYEKLNYEKPHAHTKRTLARRLTQITCYTVLHPLHNWSWKATIYPVLYVG